MYADGNGGPSDMKVGTATFGQNIFGKMSNLSMSAGESIADAMGDSDKVTGVVNIVQADGSIRTIMVTQGMATSTAALSSLYSMGTISGLAENSHGSSAALILGINESFAKANAENAVGASAEGSALQELGTYTVLTTRDGGSAGSYWGGVDGRVAAGSYFHPLGPEPAPQRDGTILMRPGIVLTNDRPMQDQTRDMFDALQYFVGGGAGRLAAVSGSSRKLGRSLINSGQRRMITGHAHHIVADGAEKAAIAQGVLKRFEIDLNSAVNGLFIPGAEHLRMHTDDYYRVVNDMLLQAEDRVQAIQILSSIRRGLRDGTFP